MTVGARYRRTLRASVLAALACFASLLAWMDGPASAALTHPLALKFPVGPKCHVDDLAVVDSTELLYVLCESGNLRTIKRFDLNGNPVNFTAAEPYLEANTITADPGSPVGTFTTPSFPAEIAVDNSTAHNGFLYATGQIFPGGEIDVFDPTGKWVGKMSQFSGDMSGVDVGADGQIYTASLNMGVNEYDTSFHEVRRVFMPKSAPEYLRADSSGSQWIANVAQGYLRYKLRKLEGDQFLTNTRVDSLSAASEGISEAHLSPFAANPLVKNTEVGAFDIDPTNDDLLVNRQTRIEPYSSGTADQPAYQDGPSFGIGVLSYSVGLTVDRHRNVYAGEGSEVVKFSAGQPLPDLHTQKPQVDDLDHTAVTVRGGVARASGPPVIDCEVQFGPTVSYGSAVPCSPDAASTPYQAETTAVSALLPGLTVGTPVHYRVRAANANGTNSGVDRVATPVAVIKVHTTPALAVTPHAATLRGSFDPDGLDTTYHFDYGLDATYGQDTPEVDAGGAPGEYPAQADISNLPAGKVFHYRLVAHNSLGTTIGNDSSFRTASPPEVAGVAARDLSGTSATLTARVNPVGSDSTYRFEYGSTTKYGAVVPLPDAGIGAGASPQDVSQLITGLQGGVTYHFRLVANNAWGSTVSSDTTFDFAPPSCPNAHVRQQTHSSYLPDCRAYELVSPPDAGSISLFPSDAVSLLDFDEGDRFADLWPVNRGLATSPPRFAYFGGLGAIQGLQAPNSLYDMFVATRTTNGWETTYPGLSGSETLVVGRKQCSDSLGECIDHNEGDEFTNTGPLPQNAAYLFDVTGSSEGVLPTNVGAIPGGRFFHGDERPSADFSHYAFSSTDKVFAPEGLRAIPPGSAYDNDIAAKSVTVISKLANGQPLPQDAGDRPDQFIEFPGVSADGSHILMQVPGADGPVHLYMRVDDSLTYDVSRGAGVTFVGMTRAGSKVIFTAAQPLTAADSDHSTDLYMWEESGDKLTLLSRGNGYGESDDCTADWVSQCDVAPLDTERSNPHGYASVPGLDNYIASESGDTYFYSPEDLDAASHGVRNARNLYVYRDGAVRLVATLDSGSSIDRMQISPDGRHTAFLTSASLTGYDTNGFREMYTYDAESGRLQCASCRPDGLPPTANVLASQGGPFMADDGRTFFATRDALVSEDSNGSIIDVYEFVDGRPQLISQGTGSRDFTGGGSVVSLVEALKAANTGLESVSADGVDVYFSTYDTLVPQDRNGSFVKFYDARTGGGFDALSDLAPCAAADECHGVGATAPQPPAVSTGGDLGPTGNYSQQARPKHRRRRTRAKRHRRHRAPTTGTRNG